MSHACVLVFQHTTAAVDLMLCGLQGIVRIRVFPSLLMSLGMPSSCCGTGIQVMAQSSPGKGHNKLQDSAHQKRYGHCTKAKAIPYCSGSGTACSFVCYHACKSDCQYSINSSDLGI